MEVALPPVRHKQVFHFVSFFKFNRVYFISRKLVPFSIVRCSSSSSAAATSVVAGGRMNKVQELRSKGLDSYAYKWERTHTANELQEIYRNLGNGEELTGESDNDNVSIAGRIVVCRTFGKLGFLTLRDDSGTIQIVSFSSFAGELYVCVDSFSILTKSLLPIPDKYHSLTVIDKRYCQRYVDMIANPELAVIFRKRAKLISEIRKTLESAGFVEVGTPVLQEQVKLSSAENNSKPCK